MASDVVSAGTNGPASFVPGTGGPGGVSGARFQAALADAASAALPVPHEALPLPPAADTDVVDPQAADARPGQPAAPTEERLQARLHAKVSGHPLAKQAVKDLEGEPGFKSLPRQSRIAILSQAVHYPNGSSIQTLRLLSGRDWFRGSDLGDQQRFAKVIAFAAQYKGGDGVLSGTLNHALGDPVKLQWHDFKGGKGGDAYHDRGYGNLDLFNARDTIRLERSYVPAGNGPIAANDPSQVYEAVQALAHEVNHHLNHDLADGTYRNFMGEYRAWYAGFTAQHGTPTPADAHEAANRLVHSTTGLYGQIGRTFANPQSKDSGQIVAFMARIMGLDPATATRAQVLDPANIRLKDPLADALPPEKADPIDVNNIDNH